MQDLRFGKVCCCVYECDCTVRSCQNEGAQPSDDDEVCQPVDRPFLWTMLSPCRCPGTGKWVESDPTSRLSYAQRTVRRRSALDDLGWDGARSEASAPATQLPPRAGGPGSGAKRERKGASAAQVRLPPDIRTELADKVSLMTLVEGLWHPAATLAAAMPGFTSVRIHTKPDAPLPCSADVMHGAAPLPKLASCRALSRCLCPMVPADIWQRGCTASFAQCVHLQQAQLTVPARAGSTTNALLTLASQTLLPSEPSEALHELPRDGAPAAPGAPTWLQIRGIVPDASILHCAELSLIVA